MIGLSLTPKDLEILHQAPKHTDKTLYIDSEKVLSQFWNSIETLGINTVNQSNHKDIITFHIDEIYDRLGDKLPCNRILQFALRRCQIPMYKADTKEGLWQFTIEK